METLSFSTQIKLILADDNLDLAIITTLLLKRHGFEVVTCSNGKECIHLAIEAMPDLILMDLDMPVMDGITACKYIRQQSWGHQIPIIALTGNEQGLPKNWLKEAGFDFLLLKPAYFNDLTLAITKTIQQKKSI